MRSYFVVTPETTIDGQAIELEPIEVYIGREQQLDTAGFGCNLNSEKTVSSTASLSKKTPRGLLMYDVVMLCENHGSKILIRNFQKS